MNIFPIIPTLVIVPLLAVVFIGLVVCIIRKKWRKRSNIRRCAILLLMLVALLRPAFPNGSAESNTTNLNLFFIVDASTSMNVRDVEDGKKFRFELVEEDIRTIANKFPGSRYSMILLDNIPQVVLPVTSNLDALLSSAPLTRPRTYSSYGGSNFTELLSFSNTKILDYDRKNSNRKNIFFFMSDGEDTVSKTIVPAALRNRIAGGAVFGYGTSKGGIMSKKVVPTKEPNGDSKYELDSSSILGVTYVDIYSYTGGDAYTDRKGRIISMLDEGNLKNIASKLGLQYYHRDNSGIPDSLIAEISSNINYAIDSITDSYVDIYWIFAAIIVGLLLWEFSDCFNKILQEKERKL